MKKFNLETGKLGEEIARKYLEKKGYKIVEQNFRTKHGQIDLIVEKGKELVVVEVRTKKGEAFGSPEESLDKRKLRKIFINARTYLTMKRWRGPLRIDAVCLVLSQDNELKRLNHYENII